MVLNCVLHRYNLPHVDKIIDMALQMGAEYLELANTQYYGWAHTNRAQLMPTAEQLKEAEAVVERYRRRSATSAGSSSSCPITSSAGPSAA